MKLFIPFLILLVLTGCSPPVETPSPPEEVPSSPPPPSAVNDSPSQNQTPPPPPEEDRRLEALGFGIFNYSILTPETCNAFFIAYQEKIIDLKETIERLEDTRREQRFRITEAEEDLADARASGNENAIERKERELDNERDELELLEEDIDDQEDLLKKYIIIKETIQDECFELKVKVGKID